MVVAVIVEFRPHAQGELLDVWQLRLVVNVLRKRVYVYTRVRNVNRWKARSAIWGSSFTRARNYAFLA